MRITTVSWIILLTALAVPDGIHRAGAPAICPRHAKRSEDGQ
jgi:hypothetical protein